MLTPYRSPAKPPSPPRPLVSGAFLHALLKAHPWLGAVLGVLGPLAACSHEDPVWWRAVLFGALGSGLMAAAWCLGNEPRDAPYVRRQLSWFTLLSPLSAFLSAALFYGGGFNGTYAAPAPVRFVVPRGERIHLPHGAYVSFGSSRVKILGGATILLHGVAARCLPPYGPLEENVMYTPDCEPEAR